MVKYYCDRCNREMPKPEKATDNSCQYHQFLRAGDIDIHIAYRTITQTGLPMPKQQDICPWCLVEMLQEELGITIPPKRRIE